MPKLTKTRYSENVKGGLSVAELKMAEKNVSGPIIESWSRVQDLNYGNPLQKRTYQALLELGILSALANYAPQLVGDSALGLAVSESKIKIICQSFDLDLFLSECEKKFASRPHLILDTRPIGGIMSAICTFKHSGLTVWITAQEQKIERQQSYLVFQAEKRILRLCNQVFRNHLENIRETGLSLDWAFANTFQLTGDPRRKLAELAACNDVELRDFIAVREKRFLTVAKIAIVPNLKESHLELVTSAIEPVQPTNKSSLTIANVTVVGTLIKNSDTLILTGPALRSYPSFKPKNLLRLLVLQDTAVSEFLVKVVRYNKDSELEVELGPNLPPGEHAVIALWPRKLRK